MDLMYNTPFHCEQKKNRLEGLVNYFMFLRPFANPLKCAVSWLHGKSLTLTPPTLVHDITSFPAASEFSCIVNLPHSLMYFLDVVIHRPLAPLNKHFQASTLCIACKEEKHIEGKSLSSTQAEIYDQNI